MPRSSSPREGTPPTYLFNEQALQCDGDPCGEVEEHDHNHSCDETRIKSRISTQQTSHRGLQRPETGEDRWSNNVEVRRRHTRERTPQSPVTSRLKTLAGGACLAAASSSSVTVYMTKGESTKHLDYLQNSTKHIDYRQKSAHLTRYLPSLTDE